MKPAAFQLDASGFMFERNASMLFARCGTGKTLVNLLALQDLIEAKVIKRALIVPPLRVAKLVWRQERDKWQIPLSMSLCTGEMTKVGQRDAIAADTNALIANYEIAMQLIAENSHGCDAVVFDELSRLRNPTGKRQKIARKGGFKFWTGCTGTPAPNGLGSIYGMAHAVGLGHLVGRNFDLWQRRYFYPTDFEQRTWAPFPDTPGELAELIKPHTYVLEDGAVELPPIVRPPIDVELPRNIRRLYDEFRGTSQLSDYDIVAGSAGVLRNKLRQISSGGFVYDNDGIPVSFDPFRLNVLIDIVAEMQGRPLIIAYEYREQLAMLRRQWPGTPYLGAGSIDDELTVDCWNKGTLPLLFLNAQSAGHGLNLQDGGNSIAWWMLPDDLELYDQTLARLARRGQKGGCVYSYEPVAIDTVEIAVRQRAHEKARVQDGLWTALRR